MRLPFPLAPGSLDRMLGLNLEPFPGRARTAQAPSRLQGLLAALGVTLLCTTLGWVFRGQANPAFHLMLYLLGLVAVALLWGRSASALATVLSMLAFDYFFVDSLVEPRFRFHLHVRNLVVFTGMVLIAQLIAGLVHRLRARAQVALIHERETACLYALTRALARESDTQAMLEVAEVSLSESLGSPVRLHRPEHCPKDPTQAHIHLTGARGILACLVFEPDLMARPFMESCAAQVALALERSQLAEEAEKARIAAETARARASLLSAVSHDLRTPLASIRAAAETLASGDGDLLPGEAEELAGMVTEEARRLDHLLGNLLDITRLEHGPLRLTKAWQPLEEVVGAVITRLEAQSGPLPLRVDLPRDLPLVPLDSVLIDQLLTNLLENARRHAPDSALRLTAWAGEQEVRVELRDHGPGIPDALKTRVFDKFYRSPGAGDGGTGLGLSICRAIVQAHGGRIWVEDAPGGGAAFRFTLPLEGLPPALEGSGHE